MAARGERRYVRVDGVLERAVADGVLLLGPDLDEPLAILGSTADVWPLLEEPRTVDELVAALADRYATDPDDVRPHVVATLTALTGSALLLEI
jgi:hypothetical protein